jgi:hypothetical protein
MNVSAATKMGLRDRILVLRKLHVERGGDALPPIRPEQLQKLIRSGIGSGRSFRDSLGTGEIY